MTFLHKFIEHEVPEEVKEWIKGEIEARYRRRMGARNFAQLVELLGQVQPDN